VIKDLDSECANLVNAVNRIPGLHTYASCCGHGEHTFKIWFWFDDDNNLPLLLYYLDR